MTVFDALALEPVDGAFEGLSPSGEQRVFGGLLVGQALHAAVRSVEQGWLPHSLHASFVRAGDGREPIRYEVEATRDGRSFATRRVLARQRHGPVLVLTAGFHADEDGPEYEPPAPGGVPAPDSLPEGRYRSGLFESRDVPETAGDHTRRAWFRTLDPLPDDPALHRCALAMLTDHGPTRAIRQPHADHPGVERRMSVSLDHSVWFHRPARVDQWLLTELAPAATGAGRGLALGSVRTEDGSLVATVAQEALLRLPG